MLIVIGNGWFVDKYSSFRKKKGIKSLPQDTGEQELQFPQDTGESVVRALVMSSSSNYLKPVKTILGTFLVAFPSFEIKCNLHSLKI